MKRRLPRGVFEREPGQYWIRYADESGRIRREKIGDSLKLAIAAYQKRKTELREGRFFPPKRRIVLFDELAASALAYSKLHKRSHSDDVWRMRLLLEWFGGRTAESISPHEIEQRVAEREWTPATANRYRSLLSLTYRLGIRDGKVSENPARLAQRYEENNARVRWLTEEEEQRLLKQMPPAHIPELDFALHTGLRQSEQFQLRWQDINWAQRVLTVPQSKHGKARHVPLNSVVVAALEKLRNDTPWVFANERKQRRAGPRYWFNRTLKRAGIENFRWHDLRHTFASRLIMAGVDIRTVAELLGHRSLAMTMRYTHLAPAHQLAAVERLTSTCTSTGNQP